MLSSIKEGSNVFRIFLDSILKPESNIKNGRSEFIVD
jgi:hypothetical protein